MKTDKKESLGRDFWYYRLGQLASVLGGSCGQIALAWWVLERSGSATVIASVLAPSMLVTNFSLLFFGPLADHRF